MSIVGSGRRLAIGLGCSIWIGLGCSSGAGTATKPDASSSGGDASVESGRDIRHEGGHDADSASPSELKTGAVCTSATECASNVCTSGKCQAPTPHDGVQNDSETGVDCGGGSSPTTDGAPACANGGGCKVAIDCQSGVCLAGTCSAPSCTDGIKDATETDIDCGGGSCVACAAGKSCALDGDCTTSVCLSGVCSLASCTDHVKDGMETNVDCGGGACPGCPSGDGCGAPIDCGSGVCAGGACQDPTCVDGVANGAETDVDCGGGACPVCATGDRCLVGSDCTQGVCASGAGESGDSGAGAGPLLCLPPSPTDGVQNGSETDVDCGGAMLLGSDGAPTCAPGKGCQVASDCASSVCTGMVCQSPSCTDMVQNGSETDVDCGGVACPGCGVGQRCAVTTDCTSNACNYASVCVTAPSCVVHNGGDTCGPGESDQGVTTNEDCCLGASVTAAHGTVILDKYKVTSGRMRAFLTAVGGDVRTFIQQQRMNGGFMAGAVMNPAWDLYLPTSFEGCDALGNCGASELTDYLMDDVLVGGTPTLEPDLPGFQGVYTSAYRWLGSSLFHGQSLPQQGCNISAPGTHTYWMDDTVQAGYFGDLPADQPQSLYDTKALNCVPYLIAQAFCIWDGGRLEFQDEYKAAVSVSLNPNGGADPMPWSASGPFPFAGQGSAVGAQYKFPSATDALLRAMNQSNGTVHANTPPAGQSIEYGNYYYSYEYPAGLGPNNDYVVFINAPGRLLGRGPGGHADLIGDLMEVTSDVNGGPADPRSTNTYWTANGSWEGHQWGYYGWNFTLVNRYGKQGLRCARPAP